MHHILKLYQNKNIVHKIFVPIVQYGNIPFQCTAAWTTDTWWLNLYFFAAQIQIPIPNKHYIKAWFFCRNNGCLNGEHWQGNHSTKMGADKLAENTPNAPKVICPICLRNPVETLQQLKDVPETARVTQEYCVKKIKFLSLLWNLTFALEIVFVY